MEKAEVERVYKKGGPIAPSSDDQNCNYNLSCYHIQRWILALEDCRLVFKLREAAEKEKIFIDGLSELKVAREC